MEESRYIIAVLRTCIVPQGRDPLSNIIIPITNKRGITFLHINLTELI